MANQEHLKILEQGVEDWSRWRDANPDIRPDLSGAKLSGATFSEANLREANLRGADLSEADLQCANLRRADLRRADLRGANFSGADLQCADLSEAILHRALFCKATIDGAILFESHIGGPGHILCALTEQEWKLIKAERRSSAKSAG